MKIGFFKKISLYLTYRKFLLKNKDAFLKTYNLRIDRVNRIYTVVNIPQELFKPPYNIRSSDINKISEPYISEFIKQVSTLLNNSGLNELYKLYDVKKIDKYSYLIVIGFSIFETQKIATNFFTKFIPISLLILIIILITHHFKLLSF